MIIVKSVVKKFEDGLIEKEVLNDINLSVKTGEFVVICGPSGSGKSTLLNLMAGFIRPDEGEIIVGGELISGYNENERALFRAKNIGFIFQQFHLIPELNVIENVMMPLLINRVSLKKAKQKALDYLSYVGMEKKAYSSVEKISGGEKQRVAIARAIVHEPKLLLADEPTGSLDSENSNMIYEIFQKLNLEKGQTIVMITHSNELAEKNSNIIDIDDGKVMKR